VHTRPWAPRGQPGGGRGSGDDPGAAEALAGAVEATAHGYAALLMDGPDRPAPAGVERAASQAAKAVRALIQGRAALGTSG
jgi:hypothetical protein